ADAAGTSRRRCRLIKGAAAMREGVTAAEMVSATRPEVGAERDLWKYSAETLEGLARWLGAETLTAAERSAGGYRAIEDMRCAMYARLVLRSRARGVRSTWRAITKPRWSA